MRGYTEIFETMLNSLRVFAESEKPLNVKEIQYEFGLHIRTAQRIAKALEDAGWITSKKTRFGKFFTATDKAKALFKKDEEITAQNNAIAFIQVHGLKKAKRIIDESPDWAKSYYEPTGQYQDQEWSDEMSVGIEDLKRLVESVALVIEHYTVERAKIYANSPYTAPEVKQALERAIADYKSIYGGGESHAN
ncbi:TPA: hypothetical protein ACNH5N_003162 [Acinetobacter baumannii]